MSHRACLYACNMPPTGEKSKDFKVTGIAEHKSEVPFVFKLMVSGNARLCPSTIWSGGEDVAIVGDFEIGAERLVQFLARIDGEKTHALVQETLDYLDGLRGDAKFVLLEPAEVLIEGDDDDKDRKRLAALLAEIQRLEDPKTYEREVARVNGAPDRKPGFLDRLFGFSVRTDPVEEMYDLGLGAWDEVLYFDPNEEEEWDEPLSSDNLPREVSEFLEEFARAFESGDIPALEMMAHWEGLPESKREALKQREFYLRDAGTVKILSVEVYLEENEIYPNLVVSHKPSWSVRYEYRHLTRGSETSCGLPLGMVEGACKIVCMSAEEK